MQAYREQQALLSEPAPLSRSSAACMASIQPPSSCACGQVLPGDVGRRLPPHFFLLPSYWRPRGARGAAGKAADAAAGMQPLPEAEALLSGGQAPGSGGHAGNGVEFDSGGDGGGAAVAVAIRGLRRDFATTDGGVKRALDGLSLDIYDGQVTALLGAAACASTQSCV
jgi:hypothetical protein